MIEQRNMIGGRYRLDATLGRGGMGTVWRAYDELLDRDVAVKEVLPPHGLSDAERQVLFERTFREARACGRLNHPNVVTVHDVIAEAGRPWIVMQYVSARSLQDILDEDGPIDPRRAAVIGRQILAALEHAHSAGILHRDIKPANLLIGNDDRAVLTDFGIARLDGDTSLTDAGLVMGSAPFISPECVMGGTAVPASDLWALGATLFAAVEGKAPYERADAISTMTAAMTEAVPTSHAAGSLMPVIDGLLRREPEHRMTAQEAARLLDDLTHRRPSSTTRGDELEIGTVPAFERGATGRHETSRRRTVLLVAGMALATVLGGGVWETLELMGEATPPAPFLTYQDPTGFSIDIPRDWSPAERRANGVFFYSPDRTAYLQVAQVAEAGQSQLERWRRLASSRRLPGYQLLRLAPLDGGPPVSDPTGANAADWEFTWNNSGRVVHVLDRGFAMNGRGYAILLSAPDSTWPNTFGRLQPSYRSFTATG